jgi:SAM-dependent methyltransferase
MSRAEGHGAKHVEAARAEIEGASGPVLDLGCGEGIFAGVSKSYVGIDISWEAARKVPRGVVADLARLPFRDAAAGGALLVNALHATADPRRVLEELARILGPGGRAYVKNDWYKSPHGRGAVLRRELSRVGRRLVYLFHRILSPGRFVARATGRGFAICPHCALEVLKGCGLDARFKGRYGIVARRP